jgi:hypothetical protein
MGAYPAKDKIDHLTSLAHAMSPQQQVEAVNFLLVQSLGSATPVDHRVPVFYVLDSLLKNANERGVISQGAEMLIHVAFCDSFSKIGAKDKTRMYRLLQSWERNPGYPIFPRHTPQLREYLNPWLEDEARKQQQMAHPQAAAGAGGGGGAMMAAKRPKLKEAAGGGSGGVDERALVNEMRRLLNELQRGLTSRPMTLEELWQSDPEQARQVRVRALATVSANGGGGGGSGGGEVAVVDAEEEKADDVLAVEVRAVLSALGVHHTLAEEAAAAGGGSEGFGDVGKATTAAAAAAVAAAEAVLRPALHGSRAACLSRCAIESKPALGHNLGSRSGATEAAHKLNTLLPCACPEDGLRFPDPRSVSVHLEVLDGRRRAAAAGGRSRPWAPSMGAWVADCVTTSSDAATADDFSSSAASSSFEGAGQQGLGGREGGGRGTGGAGGAAGRTGSLAAVAAVQQQAVAVKSGEEGDAGLSCRLCGEKFETTFDDDAEQWLYKGARELQVVEEGGGGKGGAAAAAAAAAGSRHELATVHVKCAEEASLTSTVKRSLLV